MPDKTNEQDALLDAVVAGLAVVGPDKRIARWNAWMESASGVSAQDACGKRLSQVLPGTDLRFLEGAVASAIDSGASTLLTHTLHPGLLPLKTRAGRELLHDVMVSAIGEGPGRQCLVQVADVTIAAHRERFLRDRQNARYDAVVESASDPIVTVDGDGVIRLANPAAEVQFGYGVDELVGQGAAILFEPSSAWERFRDEVTSTGAPIRPVELVVVRKDGTPRYFEVSASRWRDGTRAFITAILRDVNDRREAEAALRSSEERSRANAVALEAVNEALQKSSKALGEVDRRKDQFLATLAHELRNPLAPLRNGLSLIRLAKNDAAFVERTRDMMDRQLAHMVRLIDDLMDVSRISRDVLELNKELTSLDEIIRQAIETCRPLVDGQQHKLSLDLPAGPIRLYADIVRLTQVFANLLNNAAKYTPKGGSITVRARREGQWAVISVADTGIGIPADMLAQVFDMFMQVDHSMERTHGGLGIGLSLVRRLVEMHSGSVEAHSKGPGTGSEFVVRLPVAMTSTGRDFAAGPDEEDEPVVPRRILVVDDNEDAANSLAMVLRMMGHETRTAHEAATAMSVADAFEPEVVLLDIGMPNLNGYDTARRLRKKAWGADVLLVALTGWGQDDARRRSYDAGFNAHLVKPVDIGEVQRILASAAHQR